ncbi:7TM-DISM domain-containing protein [bacterium]|nr:7TM-DISM domain-containing protein [bacterium]
MRRFICIWLLYLIASSVQASSYSWSFFSSDTILSELPTKTKFKPLKSNALEFGYFTPSLWLKTEVEMSKDTILVFHYDHFYVEQLSMSLDSTEIAVTGSKHLNDASKNYLTSGEYFIPVYIPKGNHEILVHIQSKYSPIQARFNLISLNEAQVEAKSNQRLLWMLVYGFMLFAACVSAIFFALSSKRIFVLFTLYVVCSLVNLAAFHGFLFDYINLYTIFPYDPRALMNSILVMGTLPYFTYAVPVEYAPKVLRKIMKWIIVACAIITIAAFVIPESVKTYHRLIYTFKPLLFFAIVVPAPYFTLSYRNGHDLSKWFIAGYSVLVFTGVLHILESTGVIPHGLFNGSWEIGVVIELLVFTIAFAIQYNDALHEKLRLANQINTERTKYLEKY